MDHDLYVPSPLRSAKISNVSQASGDDSSVHRRRTWSQSWFFIPTHMLSSMITCELVPVSLSSRETPVKTVWPAGSVSGTAIYAIMLFKIMIIWWSRVMIIITTFFCYLWMCKTVGRRSACCHSGRGLKISQMISWVREWAANDFKHLFMSAHCVFLSHRWWEVKKASD